MSVPGIPEIADDFTVPVTSPLVRRSARVIVGGALLIVHGLLYAVVAAISDWELRQLINSEFHGAVTPLSGALESAVDVRFGLTAVLAVIFISTGTSILISQNRNSFVAAVVTPLTPMAALLFALLVGYPRWGLSDPVTIYARPWSPTYAAEYLAAHWFLGMITANTVALLFIKEISARSKHTMRARRPDRVPL